MRLLFVVRNMIVAQSRIVIIVTYAGVRLILKQTGCIKVNAFKIFKAVNKYNSYKNLPDKNNIQEPFKSWFENDGKLKLMSIDEFPADDNWNIDNFWSDEEKIQLGFKKADDVMTLDEFRSFIDNLVNDMINYKEAIECLKQQ